MSHEQPTPASQQPTRTAPPVSPNGPQPIPCDWLRLVSGGQTDLPNKTW
jgi:hypothetical protein